MVTKKNPVTPPATKKTTTKKPTSKSRIGKTAKDLATERGEPYVTVLSVELDPENVGNGAFELDWNDKFIVQLVKAGYQYKEGEEESVIVDRWFAEVCKNILSENYEQWEANQPLETRPRIVDRRDIGNGRTEVS